MRERYFIIAVLILFLVLVTSPIWYARAAGVTARGPEPKLPETEKACVMPVEYMRTSHMDLLMTWREQVVRQGVRSWTSPDGKAYTISLSGTCLRCHASKADFCDRCHTYAGVTPYCWDCHVDPVSTRGSRQ
jgi:cytochrome c553